VNVGQIVLLVGTDDYMPPIGSVGEIVEAQDADGDYGVEFAGHPCPNPPGTHWYAHRTWLVPLDPARMIHHETEATA
jgi:hypothetical protein